MLDLGFTREREGPSSTSDCGNFGFFFESGCTECIQIVQTRLQKHIARGWVSDKHLKTHFKNKLIAATCGTAARACKL